jgi:serine protease Do
MQVADARDLFERFRGLPGFEEYFDRFGRGEDGEEGPETDREGRSLGSGFFISSEGFVVTNNHVVENAREVIITLKDGTELEADVVGTDEQTDLAVLKVKRPGPYPYVQFSTSANPRVGDWVVAVGNPFGLGGTATAGIVSADGRQIGGPYTDFIQVDAPINRGNSGGPTFNLSGQVIGVNTAIFSDTGGGSVGIGFAIEAKAAQGIVDQLIANGKVVRGWLGVRIQGVTGQMAEAYGLGETRGAQVTQVEEDSPAEKAGLRNYDIILKVNGDDVKDSIDLTRRVGNLMAGSRNTFTIWREGKVQQIPVTVLERPADLETRGQQRRPSQGGPAAPSGSGEEYLGLTTRPMGSADASRLGLDAPQGVVVGEVARTSPFRDAGIEPGDAILRVNNRDLATPADLKAEIEASRRAGRENVVVAVRRASPAGEAATVMLPVEIGPE